MVWWWLYRVEEAEKQCKEQDTRTMELQHNHDNTKDQIDVLYKVSVISNK